MIFLWVFLLIAGFALLTLVETKFVLRFLKKHRIFDRPNARSNHIEPTPRGGGIATTDGITLGFLGLSIFGIGSFTFATAWPFLLALVLLAGISFWDDFKNVPAPFRFAAHGLAALLCLPLVHANGLVFQGVLPPFWDRLATLLLWVWFTNLYNFMDGIDGITGAETLSITGGIVLIGLGTALLPHEITFFAAIIFGVMLGFLWWNWHPAKIFLGDVGSIPLGFAIGFLLLLLAAHGFWIAALILPCYYLADSGITLLKRLIRGEKIWLAHSSHFYQRAVRGGLSHDRVVRFILASNVIFVLLAWYASLNSGFAIGLVCLALSVIEVLFLLWYLARRARK